MSEAQDYWEPVPPTPAELGDHEVPLLGECLQGRRIALLVCGGIAAIKAPLLARELRKYGAEVTAFVSAEALRYVTLDALAWSTDRPVVQALSARAEHLGDGYDAYLLAPATYNTLNKCRYGIADSLLSTVLASALGRLSRGETQVLVAPTMHGSMHNPILEESLIVLQELGVTILPPRDAYGKHNLPDLEEIVFRTARALSQSPLRGLPVLVTGGPTPVPLDAIRRLSNRFTGALGLELAKALFVAGAEVHWVHGISPLQRPAWLPCQQIESFEEYLQTVLYLLEEHACVAGIFSAAVADYAPEQVFEGKLASGAEQLRLELAPLPKVIDLVRR
ncbi:MAG TPA: phosphopantothenoylcysteine decarboxylase, partial [Candidatus Obscuribacterales bacterium]